MEEAPVISSSMPHGNVKERKNQQMDPITEEHVGNSAEPFSNPRSFLPSSVIVPKPAKTETEDQLIEFE